MAQLALEKVYCAKTKYKKEEEEKNEIKSSNKYI